MVMIDKKPTRLRLWLMKACLMLLVPATQVHPQSDTDGQNNDPYSHWGTLSLQQLSPQGKWMSYSIGYGQGSDTLFVKPAKSGRTLAYLGGRSGSFLGEKWFACLRGKSLELLDLKTGQSSSIGTADAYGHDIRNEVLFYSSRTLGASQSLHLKKLTGGTVHTYNNVEAYSYCSEAGTMAIAEKLGPNLRILIVALKDFSSKEIYAAEASCKTFQWQRNGRVLAYLINTGGSDNELVLFNLRSGEQNVLKHDDHPELLKGTITADYGPIVISGDGMRVYFQIAPTKVTAGADSPEIWNASDRVVYPSKVTTKGWSEMRKLAMWAPDENRCKMLTDERYPSVMLAADQPYAVLWDPFANEPSANINAPATYHVLDMGSGRIKPLLETAGGFAGQLSVSPGGRFLGYFRDGKWWAYEFKSGVHHDLTGKLPHAFHKEGFDWPDEPPAYGIMGWLTGDEGILVYDRYDVWNIIPGGDAKRITFGREKKETYRLAPQSQEQRTTTNFNGAYAGIIRLNRPLLFKLRSSSEAYCVRKATGTFERMIETGDMLSLGQTDSTGDIVAYMRQNHSTPPYLEYVAAGKAPTVAYRGNDHYYKMEPFRAELVSYKDKHGESLQGILYYPQRYRQDKSYPMIVHIYEKQSWEMQKFQRPSYDNGAGFNVANYIMEGYFVLLPDISYPDNNPGEAALDCIESSVASLLGRKDIDKDKIGLIGHSFGGYETDYILTRSNLFAVGVSGAAINDIPSFYHFVVPDFSRPNFWHMEYGQFRIGKPYHSDPLFYNQASPLYNSAAITTPLLSWCGKDDAQVPLTQLVSLHLSLRRQGKTHSALFYPGEGHTLSEYDNRKDLTIRISEWFRHYLKGGPVPKWAQPDK